ncbi:MAG: 4Fe-4S dicluster domain-containing protein [Candidatus Syntrophonatronum acetioxidans]|uniref:4Fe-4S dicluster domain-containing protein n=1 Tax=Candidatus Syntrophonatronum acetioxidans TaxID=1795816 RepID=A0A424YI36_9FIRM|nr:MAG: 4Fe-4S dicluster domain-containing protein [Candidatus Syntrophonatronum acetioxidans]
MVVDVKKCLGCHSCELGCAVEHSASKQLFASILEKPLPQSRVTVEHSEGTSLPLQCRHCEDPPCVKVCPTEAITKKDVGEAVLIDESLCIGCKVCILICPFGAVTLSTDDKAILKCDLCQERIFTGEAPACVSSCPTRALQFISVEEFTKEKRREFMVEFLKGE